MKPKILLIGGFGWCATSPLVYTLQRNAKYAHFGYTKQFRYLGAERNPSYRGDPNLSPMLKHLYDRVKNGTWENHQRYKPATHNMNLSIDLEPLYDFPISHFDKLMSGERSERKQLDFLHALHDHVVSKGYKSVGDCRIGYKAFRKDLREFCKLLMFEFDVKFLFITRDPVRRAYSEFLFRLEKKREGCPDGSVTIDLAADARNSDGEIPDIFQVVYAGPIEIMYTDYMTKKIKLADQIFGKDNVYAVAMEDLWEDDGTAKKELSNFLDHPIDNLWKNLYSPDIGHHVKFDKDVPCQAYGQNLELKPDTYYSLKKQCQYIYDEWKDYYGSLPLYWGEPLDYKL